MSVDRYDFIIKKEVQKSGKEIYTPMARIKKRIMGILSENWERISCVYGKYLLMELPFAPDLTRPECEIHIEEFKKTLQEETETDIASVEYITVVEADDKFEEDQK